MRVTEFENALNVLSSKMQMPRYSVRTADSSFFREKNQAATFDEPTKTIFVNSNPRLDSAYLFDGIVLWAVRYAYCYRQTSPIFRKNSEVSKKLVGHSLSVNVWYRIHFRPSVEKIGEIDFDMLQKVLERPENAEIATAFEKTLDMVDEARHPGAFTAIRIRCQDYPTVDQGLDEVLDLDYSALLEKIDSQGYTIVKITTPSLGKNFKAYLKTARENLEKGLKVGSFRKEAFEVFEEVLRETSPAPTSTKEFCLKAYQILDSKFYDEKLKDDSIRKDRSTVLEALFRCEELLWKLEQHAQIAYPLDRL
jgi:hypothetical protein